MNFVLMLSTFAKILFILCITLFLSRYIPPLKLIFKSRMVLFGIINYMATLIMTNDINLNQLPYVGFIFIYIDYLIVKYFEIGQIVLNYMR
jgi:hypothetical protein